MADTAAATSMPPNSTTAPTTGATTGAPSHHAVTEPSAAPVTVDALQTNDVEPEVASNPQLSRFGQVRNCEKHWIWKFGLRVIIIVVNIIAIGSAAWIMATTRQVESLLGYYSEYSSFYQSGLAAVVPLPISTVFCLLFIAVPFYFKPPRAPHPGIAVGFDLVFWLGLIAAGLFTMPGIFEILNFGRDGVVADPNYYSSSNLNGEYYLAPNNTWIYNVTSSYDIQYYNYTTQSYDLPPQDVLASLRDCTPSFSSCADQDMFVNMIWQTRSTRVALHVLITAVCYLDVLLHFVLFVWACVDTQRINAAAGGRKERIVAERIINDLEKRGLIMVQNGVVVGQSTIAQQQWQAHQQWQQQWYQQQNQQAQATGQPQNQAQGVQPPGSAQAQSPTQTQQPGTIQRPPQALGPHPATGFYGSDADRDEGEYMAHAR